MTKTSLSTIKLIAFAAGKAFILLWSLEQVLICGYVARLYLYPVPPSVIEIVETSKPDPIIVVAEAETITRTITKKVTKVRDELTQDQLRRLREDESGATGAFMSISREGDDNSDDGNDGDNGEKDKGPLVYRSSRVGLKDLTSQYQSLTNTLRGKMQDLEENLTSLNAMLEDYKKEAYSPAYTSLFHNAGQNITMDPADIIEGANRDALTWISNNTNVESRTQTTLICAIIQRYKNGISPPHQVEKDLQIYLDSIAHTSHNTLTTTWEQVNKAHDIAVARQAKKKEDDAKKMEAQTSGRKRMATKQDLDEYTTVILRDIRNRMEEYYMVLLPNTEEGPFLQDGFELELALYRDTSYGVVVSGAEERRDGLVRKLEDQYKENSRILFGDGDETCATESQVQSMVDAGIDAIFSQKELRNVMLDMVTKLLMAEDDMDDNMDDDMDDDMDDHMDNDDSEQYERYYATVKMYMDEMKQDNDIGDGRDDSVKLSSWAHANSLRTILLENPLFPQVLEQLNVIVEKVEGYNDVVDQVIDYIVGEESEGRTFGSTIGDVMKEALGAVPAPRAFDEMKQKAGILHFNQV